MSVSFTDCFYCLPHDSARQTALSATLDRQLFSITILCESTYADWLYLLQAAQLIELAQLQVGVQASADPAVRIMAPKTDFTSNIRQRLFR